MTPKKIRIATRQSPLALWQAQYIKDLLQAKWPTITVELLPMVTSGDKFLHNKLLVAGGKGLFVKELEEALLDNRADIAVHSTKDMPATLPQGLILPVLCKRHNPYDALISTHATCLDALPHQAIVGTSSLRRQSQLLAYRPDLRIKTLRGNIQTRLSHLESGAYDAIILAAAGLERMGLKHLITEELSEEVMLPSCGQGALSIECRADDLAIHALISPLNDPITALCVATERQVNAQLGGNCHVPLAVFCTQNSPDELLLRAKVLTPDGSVCITDSQKGTLANAPKLADRCSEALLSRGAGQLLSSLNAS